MVKSEQKIVGEKIEKGTEKKIVRNPSEKEIIHKLTSEAEEEKVKTGEQPDSKIKAEKKEDAQSDAAKLKKEEKHTPEKKKKTEAVVMADNIPISTKHSAAICKFIKNKKIENAISDLESVLNLKRAVPMKGEIPHRKGKKMMSGRFPKKASENFIRLLKSLNANSNYNGLVNPVIVEAVANIGVRPFGRFGAVRKKRTHIKIVAKDIGENKKGKEAVKN